MAVRWRPLVLIICFLALLPSVQASTAAPTYSFQNAPYVFNVNETEMTEVPLGCVTCDITDPYAVYLDRISPTCNNCFQVYNLSATGTEWCVRYVPGQLSPTLSYTQEHEYSLYLSCRNDARTMTASTIAQVRLRRNQQATFTTTSSTPLQLPVKCTSTATVTVPVSDVEGNPIVCSLLSVSPSSAAPNITVVTSTSNPTTCDISCTGSLQSVCSDALSINLGVSDDRHITPNTKTVNINLSGRTFPTCTQGCGTTHTIPESAAVGSTVTPLTFTPTTVPTIKWDKSTSASLFEYSSNKISVRTGLDYDNSYSRTSTATVTVSDGFCDAPPYYVPVAITDVNYPPEVTCLTAAWQYEEDFTVGPIISITDKDSRDRHTSQVIQNNPYCHTTNTYYLTCNGYDHDLAANNGTILVKIEVSDDSALGANTTVANCTIQVKDKNDNPPRFEQQGYTFKITNCTDPGELSPRLNVTDLDSAFQDNNLITVNPASHSCGSVFSNGAVYVTSYCPIGVHTMTVTATDHGQYPGPLTSAPITVSFVVGPCPTTPPPVTQPTAAVATAATAATTTAAATATTIATLVSSGSGVSVFAWAVPLGLLGLLAAGLSAFACYRYCCQPKPKTYPPIDRFNGPRFHTPPKGTVAPSTPSQVKPTLMKVQKGPVTPPRAPTPERFVKPMSPSPYQFNFWQETYPDADYVKQPQRGALPATDTF